MGFWTYDGERGQAFWTEEIYKLLGCKDEDLNEKLESILPYVHSDDQEMVKQAIHEVFKEKEYEIEYRIVTNKGQVRYVYEKTKALLDQNNNSIKMIGIIQDITENKLVEQELKRNYKFINQAEVLANIGSWTMDIARNRIYWSEEACRIYDLPPETSWSSYEEFKEFVHPDDGEILDDILTNSSRDPIILEFRIIKKDGSIRNIYELAEVTFNKDGNPTYINGTIQDITEKKELEKNVVFKNKEINKMNRRFNALIKESLDVFEILDPDGRLLYISETSEKVIGYKPEERLGRKIYDYHEEAEARKLAEMIEFVLVEPDKGITKDILFKTKTGKLLYLEVYMRNFMHDSAIDGIVVNFRDVTSRVENEKKIIHISTHDQLTGFPNNIYLKENLKLQYQKAKETNTSFAIFMLDIGSLAYIENTLGYKTAERYIVQVASRLKLYCGATKFIYRYYDHRFVIVVEGTYTIDEYETIIREIYELFSETVKVGRYDLDVDLNIGISTYEKGQEDSDLLIRNAETAIYMAKNEGKNKYKFYSSDKNFQSYKESILRNDLKKSIENNQLRIYYQPMVNLKTNELLGAEALIRWEHPEWGLISPIEFISLAEETGYITKIGDWLLREVCQNYKGWLNNGFPNIKVSINFSSMQFLEANFVENIKNTIDEFELNPHFLIMEITESILIEKIDRVISSIKILQSFGIQIALDDFGTGYSSLAYLNSIDIDILKIDGSFIKNINIDETSTTITRYIIKMAQELKIKLAAEHVESWDQLSFLRELKCYCGQGYIYSKPLPLEDFEKVLAKGNCKPLISKDSLLHKERRKSYKVNFIQGLEARLSILELRGKNINMGNAKVVIKNIGSEGLSFISSIRLPIEKDMVVQFATYLVGEEIKINGHPIWTEEIDNNLFEYGFEFTMDEDKRKDLIKILNQVQINMKNDS